MSIGVGLHVAGKAPAWGYSVGWSLFTVLRAFNAWFWMIAILSAGMKYLSFSNGLLRYVREGSYPFYVLHQTVLIAIGFHVMKWNTGVMPRYLTLVVATVIATTVVYDLVVRRMRVTRFLFGMKPGPR